MKPLLSAVVFAAGYCLAFALMPMAQRPRDDHAAASENRRKPSKHAERSARLSAEREASRARSMVDDWLKMNEGPGGGKDTEYSNDAVNGPLLLAEFIRRYEKHGLSKDDGWLLRILIFKWATSDPNACLDSVLKVEDHRIANLLLYRIINTVGETDPLAAIAIARMHGSAAGRSIDFPDSLNDYMGKADAETFVRTLSYFNNGDGAFHKDIEFAPEFDFSSTLKLLTEYKNGLKGEAHLSYDPAEKMLSEWAERDWNAAWEWVLSGGKSDSDDMDIYLIVEAAMPHSTTEQIAGYMAQAANSPTRGHEKTVSDISDLFFSYPSTELLSGFLSQASTNRQWYLNHMLSHAIYSGNDGTNMILSQMTPAERLSAFQSANIRKDFNKEYFGSPQVIDPIGELASLLGRLGHSEEEIARMLPDPSQK